MGTLHTEAGYPSAGAEARPWRSEIKKSIPKEGQSPNVEASARGDAGGGRG